MILTPDNEYCVVLDSCILVPMPICDTFLRMAEEPAFFRLAWSEQILEEVRKSLEGPNFGYSPEQVDRRFRAMKAAFPEALVTVPPGLIDGIKDIPDPNDRHVVAVAIQSRAYGIISDNVRHFPAEALSAHELSISSSDEFLVHQYHLNPTLMLEKLDRQAAGIRRTRGDLLQLLRNFAPAFFELCAKT